ncbi:MAG: endonuclease III [Verrucomicrobiota bacterium]|nr:endonuclease III [Verrucomicrobiota bacterium]
MRSSLVSLAREIGETLDRLFPNPTIPLHHKDPYTLLIAVLLSAQCTDERVNRITPELFSLAETAEEMALLDPKEIEKVIRPCGLAPTKARAIHKLSQLLITKHGGSVPASLSALEELPGVGHKTASVVMAQAFQKPAFPVDTHIFRAAHRWGLSKGKSVIAVEKDLKRLFPRKEWTRRHLQIILFCRRYCPARGHVVKNCPICGKILLC